MYKNDIKEVYNLICELKKEFKSSGLSRERVHNLYMKNGFKKGSFKFKMELEI